MVIGPPKTATIAPIASPTAAKSPDKPPIDDRKVNIPLSTSTTVPIKLSTFKAPTKPIMNVSKLDSPSWCASINLPIPSNASAIALSALSATPPVHLAIGFRKLSQSHSKAGFAALIILSITSIALARILIKSGIIFSIVNFPKGSNTFL